MGERIEPKSMDIWALLSGSRTPPEETLLVTMDEASYKNLNIPLNQAWPRKVHVSLLKKLEEAKVKRVIFDVLFIDSSDDKKTDQDLATAFGKVQTILGADSLIRDFSSASGSFKLEEMLLPYKPFLANASELGLIGFPEDHGFVRRFLTQRSSQTKGYLTLSEAGAEIQSSKSVLPGPRDFIKYYGPAGTIPYVNYYQIIDPDKPIPANILKDKIVFVGLVLQTDIGPSQKDVFMTPFGRIFGTEIHATSALNLIHNDWIKRAPKWKEFLGLSLISLLITTSIFALRPLWGMIGFFITIFGWSSISYISYINNFFFPGLLLVGTILPFSLLTSVLYYYFVTRQAELKMVSAFELYLSPQMAKEVSANQKSLRLGGEKVWATAMFTDIQGFTSLSESMAPEKVSAMLNAYFTEVMDVVFKNDGTLIKFIGDAVFVIWGAPVKMNNHAEKACLTAIAIQEEVRRFNNSGRFPALNTRIGIHTGPMVVGNLGSAKRFDYTAIGDSVNLASRIEGINKYFGTQILITDDLKKEISGNFNTLSIGSIKVSGKDEAIKLYILLESSLSESLRTYWEQALNTFKNKNWSESTSLFSEIALKYEPFKKAAEFYLNQIESFKKTPPESAWQGEITFLEK